MDLIACIDSRCVLPNVGLRLLHVPYLKLADTRIRMYWQSKVRPVSMQCDARLAFVSCPDVLWAMFREDGQFVQFVSYHNPNMWFDRWVCVAVELGRILNENQAGSQGRVGLVGNLNIVGVDSDGFWLRDTVYVGQRLGIVVKPLGGWVACSVKLALWTWYPLLWIML